MQKIDLAVWPRAELFPADGRGPLGMCLEVNHRFVDGWHLGQFYQHLQQAIDALKI